MDKAELSSAELDFFLNDPEKLPIYLSLRAVFRGMAPGCIIRVLKSTIAFDAPRPFVYVSLPFRKHYKGWPPEHLVVSFSRDMPLVHPNVVHSTPIRPALYTIHALIPLPGNLDEVLTEAIMFSLRYRNQKKEQP